MSDHNTQYDDTSIAIVGMAGRFPKARNLDEFWQNLCNDVEGITFMSDEELLAAGVDASELEQPDYVKAAGGLLEDFDHFDAQYFDYTPREAEIIDPQQRVFLECAVEALENAGYDSQKFQGAIAVFAGTSLNNYGQQIVEARPEVIATLGGYQVMLGNDKDFLSTVVSYKLNLKGPSLVVQTACSTSLVAVAQACQSLLNYQCDLALSGGVSITRLQRRGYRYQPGGIASPDGHCRPFDQNARGTIAGDGVGIVVLKRLTDAIAEGDFIHAVIRGFALNNDGAAKVGFTAPSVEGQAEVLTLAQTLADIPAGTIGYIEAHGTATELGDPIEVEALTRAFRTTTDKKNFCALGSLKSNIGHLDAAAGVAGLIKTVLALEHRQIPASLHFEKPNPQIDFANSPFYVNASLSDWPAAEHPRRAGVSSFGIGGTNAHVILEEAPPREAGSESRPAQLLTLSAKSKTALDAATQNLGQYLKMNKQLNLADVTYTLRCGRRDLPYRRSIVCRDTDEAIAMLQSPESKMVASGSCEPGARALAFMFPGQGAQYPNMARQLYETEKTFRDQVDTCVDLLRMQLDFDLRSVLFPEDNALQSASEKLKQTSITQPALFVIEYALARLWMKWGLEPQALIGHSIGEYVAACLAGIFSLEDSLSLVAKRGMLMQNLPAGAMLAVSIDEKQLSRHLNSEVELAAINARGLCVVSGAIEAIDAFEDKLRTDSIGSRRLHTSHAFHSSMMDPIMPAFEAEVNKIQRRPPQIPLISNVSGTWITAEEAIDGGYWARHLRQPVRFAAGVQELLRESSRVLLEVGPNQILSSLAKMNTSAARKPMQAIIASSRHPHDAQSDIDVLVAALGHLWLAGVKIDWDSFYGEERRLRVPLPTYPFQRQRYWIEPGPQTDHGPKAATSGRKSKIADWLYTPSWKRTEPVPRPAPPAARSDHATWLVFADDQGMSEEIVARLDQSQTVITVSRGQAFSLHDEKRYIINPRQADHYDKLIASLAAAGNMPETVAHFWTLDGDDWLTAQTNGFYSLLYLTQALSRNNVTGDLQLSVISNGLFDVYGNEALHYQSAAVLGACRVIAQEYPNINCRNLDLSLGSQPDETKVELAGQLYNELAVHASEPVVAYRGRHRWVRLFDSIRSGPEVAPAVRLRQGGVYLITGGLGKIGLALAEHLAANYKAKLALSSRTAVPVREKWDQWLKTRAEDDPMSSKIRRLRQLESSGSELLTLAADVADEDSLRQVLEQTEQRFGALHGVIHAAGVMSGESFREISEISVADCEQQFRPKIAGAIALGRVLNERELDFCLLCSSISSLLGGLGFVAYAAANSFLDCFAQAQHQAGRFPWISVNWDAWNFATGEESSQGLGAELRALAIRPEEGQQALESVLHAGRLGLLIVSTTDLQARIDRWSRLDTGAGEEPPAESSAAQYARPELKDEYTAPRNEIEQTLAEIWQQLFGIDKIGIHDNFFDLGGHSLLATSLTARIRDTFHIELSLRSFLERPTIAELSETVLEQIVEHEDSETLSQMLEEIEGKS